MKMTELDYIKDLQRVLKAAGFYEGKIDGIVGQLTVSAVYKACNCKEPTTSPAEDALKYSGTTTDAKETTAKATSFADFLNQTSLNRLKGVKTNLIKVVALASQFTKQPFMITEGLRTYARQEELVKSGASKTLNSKHLTGDAVDLAPLVNGKISWEQKDFYPLAEAMRRAATTLNIDIRWGGAWAVLNYTGAKTPKSLIDEYGAKKRAAKQSPFIDCPHFELV